MKIYVTGDTQQENNSEKLSEENFVEQKELTKDDFVIITGDFGYYWNEKSKKEIESREKLATKPFTILYIEGNHDNYDFIEKLAPSWSACVNSEYLALPSSITAAIVTGKQIGRAHV